MPSAESLIGEALVTAAAEAKGIPASLTERSARARAEADGVSVEQVMRDWVVEAGLATAEVAAAAPAPTTPEPAATPAVAPASPAAATPAVEEPAAPAVEVLPPTVPVDEAADEEEVEQRISRYPAWLAAVLVVIPLLAALYVVVVPNQPICGSAGQLAVDPATGMAVDIQRFDYDSEYWGVGARGELLFGSPEAAFGIPNLQYYAELVLQTGKSFPAFETRRRESIRGWAADVGLTYHWNTPWQPRIELELAQASGDDDRRAPQSTAFGNQAGTTDRGFLGFGYVNTGVSYAPLLANLQFIRLGGAVRPFENCYRDCDSNWLRHMEVGVNGFAYWRPKNQGGTSDIRNDRTGENFLGGEADLFVSWRLSSDLYMLLNYGIFLPNDQSFSDSRGRQFLSWNLNWLL
ncbi:MAG: alginate export family protein [Acidobacteria bacterium]|nr:alginate export family protein [Acidobacteriota bacterium]